MQLLVIFAILRAVSIASTFNLRGLGNDTSQKQEKGAGLYSRITNGVAAAHHWIPYQVGLRIRYADGNFMQCGGSLISNQWVLTAAHCLRRGINVDVLLGSVILNQPHVVFHRVPRSDMIEHYRYDYRTHQYDIGVIKIPEVKFSEGISTVTLSAQNTETYHGAYAYLSGWGRISDSSDDLSPSLLYYLFRIIPNSKCASVYGSHKVYPGTICTASSNRIAGCVGDSGGPLVLEGTNIQIGVFSFGYGLGCELGYPDVYTLVSYYLDWINRHTGLKV